MRIVDDREYGYKFIEKFLAACEVGGPVDDGKTIFLYAS